MHTDVIKLHYMYFCIFPYKHTFLRPSQCSCDTPGKDPDAALVKTSVDSALATARHIDYCILQQTSCNKGSSVIQIPYILVLVTQGRLGGPQTQLNNLVCP